MDKSWIDKPRSCKIYTEGVNNFIKFALAKESFDGKIYCPCRKCFNRYLFIPEIVEEHLVCNGFLLGYTKWIFHGETMSESTSEGQHGQNMPSDVVFTSVQANITEQDGIRELLQDALGVTTATHRIFNENRAAVSSSESSEGHQDGMAIDSPNEESTRYHKLIQDSDQELYPGCKNYSKMSFILHLFHLKCLNGWSGKSFTMLLELLKDAFPDGNSLPPSSYEAKKVLTELNLGYEKIHSCPNDCMLYWGSRVNQESCHVCGSSRWATNSKDVDDDLSKEESALRKKKAAKVLRYFPLIPRLKRFFMSSKTAASMRWHDEGRNKDGVLRHPADGLAWKSFDIHHPDFAFDPRSVRFGLASDGFNPFRTMSSTHSTWPVILIPYNLPPWLCMKRSSLILSMVIPGVKGPGNDIDIYLQPLIEELKQLWDGVEAFDASTNQNFNMRAALMWTINDFPAYANLSGWSTKGRVACPSCGSSTDSYWLKNGGKFCYLGHRRWLEGSHPFRFQNHQFDGTTELRTAPSPPSGTDVLRQLEGINYKYGKSSKLSRKRPKEDISTTTDQELMEEVELSSETKVLDDADGIDEVEDDDHTSDATTHGVVQKQWKKRSIFFDLPYWEYNLLRHNLDVMHIEKNVCDNLIGTFLNLSGKSKDNLKSRLDLKEMGIRHDLHPKVISDDKVHIPEACYTMSSQEKVLFLTVLKNLKVPDGYASNISRCVNLRERTLSNLKSHDCHILMQDILPLALRASMPKEVVAVVSELSSFFKGLCSKALNPKDLDDLEYRAALTLCHMEKIFPPSFFTIMVHLVIHLAAEAKLGGPVHYRWMYPIESSMMRLKSYVRNKAQPEGSIAEGYIAEECLTFCSRYFEGVETIFNRSRRNCDNVNSGEDFMFLSGGRAIGKVESVILDEISLAQAHRYVLLHYEKISNYRSNFLAAQRRANRSIRANQSVEHKWLVENFSGWLLGQVPKMAETKCSDEIIAIARGPNNVVKKFSGFIINGFRFHTKDREKLRKTQNSGIMVEAEGQTYYGVLTDIIELDYFGNFKVVLFRCDWADIKSQRGLKKDTNGYTLVNFSKLIHTGRLLKDDPFVFSSQAKQVFYIQDSRYEEWSQVVMTKPRDLYDMGAHLQDDAETYTQCMSCDVIVADELNDCISWARKDTDGQDVV